MYDSEKPRLSEDDPVEHSHYPDWTWVSVIFETGKDKLSTSG